MTNKDFALKDKLFQDCCAVAKLEPTRRQASKYRSGKGLAFLQKHQVHFQQKQEKKPDG